MRTLRRAPILVPLLIVAGLLAAACSSTSASPKAPSTSSTPSTTQAPKNIVQIASANPDFSTLVSAVQAAGLVSTLKGTGPFTVFAPTNEAFATLPPGTLQTLLQPQNKATLAKILTYHVVSGSLMAKDVMPGPVKTVEGTSFTINTAGPTLTITDGKGNAAHIVKTDIVATNGVIHVINAVLQPAS